jgi:hypothetical protein
VEEGREHLIKGDVFKTNLKGEHDKEKTLGEVEGKQQHKKPEKKDVVADILSEGKYDDNYAVEEGREHLIKGDGFKTNLKGEHDEEKTVEKQPYEKPEKVVGDDINSDSDVDSEYAEYEVVEKELYDAPRLGREEYEQKLAQMEEDLEKEKTEKKSKNKSEVQGDGLDDAKETILINEVDVVRRPRTRRWICWQRRFLDHRVKMMRLRKKQKPK